MRKDDAYPPAHDYAEVNLDRLWVISEVEVPRMIRVVEPLVPPA